MINNLLLPKVHLSWTQLDTWNTNRERYIRETFFGGKKLDTKFLRFGKGIADLMEQIAKDLDLLTDKMWMMDNFSIDIDSYEGQEFISNLRFYDTPEHEIRCEVAGIPCLSYLDSWNSQTMNFREYKTGKIPWTQSKVQKHDQLVFYATMLKWSTGKMPEYCDLDWIETRESKEEASDFWREGAKIISVTGRIISFHREFDEREIERMEQLIIRTATEISEAYTNHINSI